MSIIVALALIAALFGGCWLYCKWAESFIDAR